MRELEPIIRVVCSDLKLPREKIVTDGRRIHDPHRAAARAAVVATLRRFGHSWPSIAEAFGMRSHTSAVNWTANPHKHTGYLLGTLPLDLYAEIVSYRVELELEPRK